MDSAKMCLFLTGPAPTEIYPVRNGCFSENAVAEAKRAFKTGINSGNPCVGDVYPNR